MKKLLMTVMALSCFAFSSYGQKKVEKQIIGKWCNPYTYQSTGELKGIRIAPFTYNLFLHLLLSIAAECKARQSHNCH